MRWVIGDVHGMFAPLETMLLVVARLDREATFYFVGDYINRGPESRRVLDLLVTLKNAKFVRGNHDDVFDLILNEHWLGGEEETFDPVTACSWFLKHGLRETLLSYGITNRAIEQFVDDPSAAFLDLIRVTVPKAHAKFVHALPVFIGEKDALIAHAFWPPEELNDDKHIHERIDDDAEMNHRVIWERWKNYQVLAEKPWKRPGFFGHTPVQNYPASMRVMDAMPVMGPMVTLLDTAIALGSDGRLTAVCIEDGQVVQIDRECRVVAP